MERYRSDLEEEKFNEPRDRNGQVIFEKLDIEFLKERFNISKITVLGDKIYVGCSMDEFYIQYVKDELTLFHKNYIGNTKGYHKETRKFDSVFSVLSYCNYHNSTKYKALGHKNTRVEQLCSQIALSKKQKSKGKK